MHVLSFCPNHPAQHNLNHCCGAGAGAELVIKAPALGGNSITAPPALAPQHWYRQDGKEGVYFPVLRIRIRDPVPFWPLDPGWKKRIRDGKKFGFGIKTSRIRNTGTINAVWCLTCSGSLVRLVARHALAAAPEVEPGAVALAEGDGRLRHLHSIVHALTRLLLYTALCTTRKSELMYRTVQECSSSNPHSARLQRRGLQRDVVYLGWPIAPKCGGTGVGSHGV